MSEYKRLSRELVYQGVIVDFYQDTMQIPNGNEAKWDLISHKGATAVVAVRDDGTLFMVRQYRNPLERMTLELPAGALNSRDEEPELCARRELEEETGYKAGKMEHLVDIYTTVAFCDEKISMYVASDLIPSKQNLDENEFLNVEVHTIDSLIQMIYEGKIQDSKTIVGLMTYYHKYCNK
ncbi:MAG: NUDIX hydrolase [Lachnospiraceae bacterium]|nr:NUDIX hydrolase [Lachnospiraceae bacterium]